MRKISIRQLREQAAKLVRAAERGEAIVIERRGVAVAELRGIETCANQPPLPDMSDVWNSFPQVRGDSGKFLEEGR